MDSAAIRCEGLSKTYDSRAVLDGIGFSVESGSCFALLGPNGAGKTTTVEILEGYRRPDRGLVKVLGLDPIKDARRLRRRVGLMLQDGGVYPGIKVGEAVRLFASYYQRAMPVEESLDLVGLAHKRRNYVRTLSGGEKQRLNLALALIAMPEVLFLDEPTSGMDPQARVSIWAHLKSLDGVTILLATHDFQEAEKLADRVAILNHGSIVELSTSESLEAAYMKLLK